MNVSETISDPRMPQSGDEWQIAANLAEGALLFHSARCYGLVTGGPEINVERCKQFLAKAKDRGILPADDAHEWFLEYMKR